MDFFLGLPATNSGFVSAPRFVLLRPEGFLNELDTSETQWVIEAEVEQASARAALGELRRLTGFTWDQIANLFGVSRRSVHFWASGKRLSSGNETKLARILAAVRTADSGSASTNRAMLLAETEQGVPFDLLAQDRIQEALDLLGRARIASPQRSLSPLSLKEQGRRRPAGPEALVGALDVNVTAKPARSRVPKSVKVKASRGREDS